MESVVTTPRRTQWQKVAYRQPVMYELNIQRQGDRQTNLQRKDLIFPDRYRQTSHTSFLLPLEQPLRRAPLTGALCKSALTRAFRPTFSFCMAFRASLTEFTTFTMLIWLSDSSCDTQRRVHVTIPNLYTLKDLCESEFM